MLHLCVCFILPSSVAEVEHISKIFLTCASEQVLCAVVACSVVDHKKVPLLLLWQMCTDFSSSFTVAFSDKLQRKLLKLTTSPPLKSVATLASKSNS